MTTSSLGVSGLELHASGTESVTFFGAQSSLGGAQFSFGGAQAVYWGTRPRNVPVAQGYHDVMIVAEVCVHNTEKFSKHANVNFVSDPGVLPSAGIFFVFFYLPPAKLFILSFRSLCFFHFQYTICKHKSAILTLGRQLYAMSTKCRQTCNNVCFFRS